MKLFFVRHGETTMNREDRISGWLSDPDLTRTGENQAVAAGEKLKNRGVDVIFTSDLLRTQRTAQIIRETVDPQLPIYNDWLLRERWHGKKEFQSWTDTDWNMINQKDASYGKLYDIEFDNLTARTKTFIRNLQLLPVRYNCAVVVTSGGIMTEIAKILQPDYDKYETDNAEVREYDLRKLLEKLEMQ